MFQASKNEIHLISARKGWGRVICYFKFYIGIWCSCGMAVGGVCFSSLLGKGVIWWSIPKTLYATWGGLILWPQNVGRGSLYIQSLCYSFTSLLFDGLFTVLCAADVSIFTSILATQIEEYGQKMLDNLFKYKSIHVLNGYHKKYALALHWCVRPCPNTLFKLNESA